MSDIPRIFQSALDRMRMHKAAAVPQTVSARYNLGAPVTDIDGSNDFGYDPKDVDVYSMGSWNDHRFGRFLFDDSNKTPEQNQNDWDEFFKRRMDARHRYNAEHGITETSNNGGDPVPTLALRPYPRNAIQKDHWSFNPQTSVYFKRPKAGASRNTAAAPSGELGITSFPAGGMSHIEVTDGAVGRGANAIDSDNDQQSKVVDVHEGDHVEVGPHAEHGYVETVLAPFRRLWVSQQRPIYTSNINAYGDKTLGERSRSNFGLKAFAHRVTGEVVNSHKEWLDAMARHGYIIKDKNGEWVETDKLRKHPLYTEVTDDAGRGYTNDVENKLNFINSREQYERDVRSGKIVADPEFDNMIRQQDYLMEGADNNGSKQYHFLYGPDTDSLA